LRDALAEGGALNLQQAAQLNNFISTLCGGDLLDAQANYSELFDRGRATSMLLFEHVHGESRDRGQAMVNLMNQYQQAGMEIDSRELPDHLPLYLEYLSQREESEARGGLQDVAPILALLAARLKQRESVYAVLFDVLLGLSQSDVAVESVSLQIANEARDDTPQALDAVWEEEQVKFVADAGCGESEISSHQRRFAGAVAPQYLNIGGQ
ncbi:nitrate reductase molybdenum cofactor assembly chaperone, partial [Buttiauxella gaviniae]|uniref:nitrate reductase molybdenum cofactor assembly chaperone n=1 Tax=Buttiauxella gaviniae TaxID=82990 RepID=UPI003C76606E